MTRRRLIWIAACGNALLFGTTLAVLGWNSVAAHVAARGTARFSMAWFVVGFAAPGLRGRRRALPPEDCPGQVVMVVLFGAGLTLMAGLTATPRPSRVYRAIHRAALYAVFLIFLLAFGAHPSKPMRLLAAPVALALLLRMSSGRRWGAAQAETAQQ